MKKQTRIAKTIALMKRGWVTALESAQAGGVLALSQRVSHQLGAAYVVHKRWVKTRTGAKVMSYRITGERK